MAIRGGGWTREHKGCSYNYARCKASGAKAHDWCRKYRWQATFDINLRLVDDEDFAKILCREWCRRAQHYFDVFTESENPNYIYTDADTPPSDHEDFNIIMSTVLPTSYEHMRGTEILAFVPRHI